MDLELYLSRAAVAGCGGACGGISVYYLCPYRKALGPTELKRLVALSDGHIKISAAADGGGGVRYHCDMEKREAWAFHTNRTGLELLAHLVMVNQPALAVCRHILTSHKDNTGGKLERDGKDIYKEKKSLLQGVPGQKKVTWTQDEYAHEGMQLHYLSIKCWQRFTETWALLERAGARGLMAAHEPGGDLYGQFVSSFVHVFNNRILERKTHARSYVFWTM